MPLMTMEEFTERWNEKILRENPSTRFQKELEAEMQPVDFKGLSFALSERA
tara:strand:+ start:987 stop:1139 length:153 start_codon:yes stop_codon:yes gene_type:complete